MTKVVVFGGSGFLGSYVADELSKKNFDVVIADLNAPRDKNISHKFEKVDVSNMKRILEVLKNASIVYNFAAIAELEQSLKDPLETFQINVMGNLNILEGCKQTQTIKRYIYASSAYALSNTGSFYGISKKTSEKLIEEYYLRYELKYTIIRYGSLYGERPNKNNYIYNLLKNAISNGKLRYAGNDDDIREYIHAADAAKLSVNILDDTSFENENVILTGAERLKRIDLILMINEIMQNKLKIEKISDENPLHYKTTPYSYNPSVTKKLVANPYIDLGQGLISCIKEIYKDLEINKG